MQCPGTLDPTPHADRMYRLACGGAILPPAKDTGMSTCPFRPIHHKTRPKMPDIPDELNDLLRQAEADLAAVATPSGLEDYRIKYLGGKGLLKAKMSLIGQAPPDQK